MGYDSDDDDTGDGTGAEPCTPPQRRRPTAGPRPERSAVASRYVISLSPCAGSDVPHTNAVRLATVQAAERCRS